MRLTESAFVNYLMLPVIFDIPINWKIDRDRLKKIPKETRRVLNPEEIEKLLDAMPPDSPERAFCEFIVRTGCRPGEAQILIWNDLDLDKGEMKLTQTKTHQVQTRQLSPKLVLRLKTWRSSNENIPDIDRHVFTFKGRPVKTGALRSRITKACRLAGIKPTLTGPGTLRHSFIAALVYQAKLPKEVVQRIIGHSSVTTTEIYLSHFQPIEESDVTLAVDQLY